MDILEKCREQSLALEKKIRDSRTKWQTFTSSQIGFKSAVKLNGKVLPPPVMTAEKRKKMQMYRKQAYITEIRLKSHSREKDFLSKIQVALDEVRDFHIDTSESSEADEAVNKASSQVPATYSGPCDNKAFEYPELPPLALNSKPRESYKSLALRQKAKSTTDISSVAGMKLMTKPVPRIHRKRCMSEGKSEGDIRSKPPMSSSSQCHSQRLQSNSSLPIVPFEQYQKQVEELELSKARQRYRDSRNRMMRSPSPQPPAQNETQSLPARPASTPAVFSSEPPKQTVDEDKNHATISTHALKLLLDSLDPSHDQPTHLWLSSRVSEQGKDDQEDISLDAWFQNAPDSVKQKLVSLMPRLSHKRTDDCKVSNKSVHISPVQTCNSSDDTLRSTSPLPEEDASITSQSIIEYPTTHITSDDLPLVVIEKSPSTSPRNSPNGTNGTDSKSAADPSGTSIDTVIEVDIVSSKRDQLEPIVPPLELSALEPPMSSTFMEQETVSNFSPSKHTRPVAASERKRSLSMQSYTLEEPSEALLNSTLNDRRDCCVDESGLIGTSPSTDQPAISECSTKETPYGVDKSERDGSVSQKLPMNSNNQENDLKAKISMVNSGHQLLSKCQLETPPSPRECGRVVNSRTPVGTARHRQLIKLVSLKSTDRRSLTPTPPGRELTPTPPRRPHSEMGTQSSSSRHGKTTPSPSRPLQRNSQLSRLSRKPQDGEPTQRLLGSPAIKSTSSNTVSTGTKTAQPTSNINDKKHADVNKDSLLESPLKTYKNREERISQARKQLALLKMKVSARTQSISSERSRAKSSFELGAGAAAKRPMSSLEINGGIESRRSKSAMEIEDSSIKESENLAQNKMAARLAEQVNYVKGKENISIGVMKAKSSKKLHKERDRPITTAYSTNLEAELLHESKFRTNLAAISSRMSRPLSSNSKPSDRDSVTTDAPLRDKKLHGLIKGHLCRKLFKCSKVKSLIKTIQDCQSLLPSIVSVNKNSPARDVNFQQRIKLQMSAAKEDLYDIFFNFETCQRLALVKQSDKLLACQRGRQARKKHQGASKWKVKEVVKKCQQQVNAAKVNSSKVDANPPSRITAVF
ncbi:serine/arginine repetitive matrix protein 1-like [Watersipora subatra]|uniref:serine/arginine repetitive matrix protein 1-like n=1 Tax=Watersipora subatra TaxID=2589382 RepID=UPI00355BC05E